MTKVLALLALTLGFLEMVSVLLALHPLDTHSFCSNSLLDFRPKVDLELFVNFFRLKFLHMAALSISGPFGMFFKYLIFFWL